MNPYIWLALQTCPSAFRRRYASQLLLDYADRGITSIPRVVVDLIATGLTLRAEDVGRNIVLAYRTLVKSPFYTVTAVAAIALAIGANVAVASIFQGVFLAPLPYADPTRLMLFSASRVPNYALSYPNAADLAASNRSFSATAFAGVSSGTLTGSGPSQQLLGSTVSASYFDVLGVRPLLGRYFTRSDAGSNRVVISQNLWQRSFASDPQVVGRAVHLAGSRLMRQTYVIVGVAPESFRDPVPAGLKQSAFWAPADPRENSNTQRAWNQYLGIGRLLPGVDAPAALADLRRVATIVAPRDPDNQMRAMNVTAVAWNLLRPVSGVLLLLYAAVAIVLVIACANVANLSLVRAKRREAEFSVRRALGASRGDIIRTVASETALVAVAGGILGIVAGYAMLAAFSVYGATVFPRWEAVRIDGVVLAYAVGLVVLTTCVSGILPAFLRGRRSSIRVSARANRSFLVIEMALAMAIVTSAGLLLRSFDELTHVALGYDVQDVAVVQVDGLALPAYKTPAGTLRLADSVISRLRAVPGVESAVGVWSSPLGVKSQSGLGLVGRRLPDVAATELNAVTPGYFGLLHIPLLRGRDFTRTDTLHQVAIVSAAFAREYFGTTDILGKRIAPTFSASGPILPWTVIGVAADTRDTLTSVPAPMTYFPLTKMPNLTAFIVRTHGPVSGFGAAVNRVFADIDPNLPPPRIRALSDSLAASSANAAFETVLFTALAGVALLLALLGIYAVAMAAVQARAREFAIRKSIGARSERIVRGVVGEALATGIAGAAIGFVLVAALQKALMTLLYETSPFDLATISGSSAIVIGCALAASTVPAVRAIRANAAVALRYE